MLFLTYCPLQILALKTCNQDISKTITASKFNLRQLIEDNEQITWGKLKKILFYCFNYCPLQILALKTCNQHISKTTAANTFEFGQPIEDNK